MIGVVAEEYCGTPSKRRNVFILRDEKLQKFKNGRLNRKYDIGTFFNEVFFPEGYPESVSKDYLSYQVFDTIQAFCSSINGTIATQSILQGLGVGEEATTALAATMTWVLKDGVGMIGRIVFAWAQGTDLDCDLKRWRLRADILNDFSMLLDVCAASTKGYFVIVVCLSALLKSIVGIAGVGTRPAVIQHQARRNNIGDVAAKDASQETLVNLAALVTSLLIMPILARTPWLSWLTFFLLAGIHILSNYYAVRSLSLETFNQARFHLAVTTFFGSGGTFVPSVSAVNYKEPVLLPLPKKWSFDIGCRLPKKSMTIEEFEAMRNIYSTEVYCLHVLPAKGRIAIYLSPLATQEDIVRGTFEAELLAHKMKIHFSDRTGVFDAMRDSRAEVEDLYHRFGKLARAEGWDFSRNYMGVKEWRVTWRNPTVHGGDLVTL